ncbi:MAG: EI24 domain-containing protein [Bdellovibrionaceae bacterium]|nr:EI24 domain-containing protein [Pseudobdellovibrionaceae bacterium]
MNSISEYTKGLKFIFSGFKVILTDKSLWLWAMAPIIIDLTLLIYLLNIGLSYLTVWVVGALSFIFTDPSGVLYSILYYPLYIFFAIGFTVIIVFAIYLIGTVIASPFNSVIAEKVLVGRGVLRDRPFQFSRWIKTSIKMMMTSLLRVLIFAFIGIFLFVFTFIPGLNLLSSFFAFIVLAFDNMDYSYEAMEYRLTERLSHLKQNALLYSGMGSIIGLTLLIPGLTLILMPFLVAGAAVNFIPTKNRV